MARSIDWKKYPVRVAESMSHRCRICDKPIEVGEQYRDGGQCFRRAHLDCTKRGDNTDRKVNTKFDRYPLRICRTLHHCAICYETIVIGEVYLDGGYGRRAHKSCNDEVKKNIEGVFNAA